jgi:UDP-N-acetylglucosamine 2-epimerase (non-hydrolysing)
MREDKEIDLTVLSLAQHRQMLDQMLSIFKITPDLDLNAMKEKQTLSELTANLLRPLDETLSRVKPDIVLSQGDTTSTFAASLASAYQKIPFGHIEAGLRTYNYNHPFPEEINRVLVSRLSSLHFAPTELSKSYLLKEGIQESSILVTGNTVIDALHWILKRPSSFPIKRDPSKKLVLVTLHRRENWTGLEEICQALHDLAESNNGIEILIPVHLNPKVRPVVQKMLGNHKHIILTEPLGYVEFITAMKEACLILSDSGGVQEEAPSLGVPVLILREHTERMEGVHAGFCKLIGTAYKSIIEEASKALNDPSWKESLKERPSPYGDGQAASRIVSRVKSFCRETER